MNPHAFAAVPRRGTAAAFVLAMSAALLAGGCSILGTAAPDASRYFVLSSTDGSTVPTPARTLADVHFGLGPIKLPGYLDTQGLVLTGSGGSVEYVPNAFWAEPVGDGFSRALLYRTGARIGTTHGIAFPWYSTTRVDWKVPVDVLRFEATADGHAVLVARWSVQRTSDNAVAGGAESSFTENAGTDPGAIVDAESRCIDRLAEAIAAAVASAATMPPPAVKGGTARARSASAPAAKPAAPAAPAPSAGPAPRAPKEGAASPPAEPAK